VGQGQPASRRVILKKTIGTIVQNERHTGNLNAEMNVCTLADLPGRSLKNWLIFVTLHKLFRQPHNRPRAQHHLRSSLVTATPIRIKPPSPQELAAGDAIKLADLLAAEAHEDDHESHAHPSTAGQVPEIGGRRDGPDPTRYGDWEKNGRCIDF
jgi:hypothetical protein